MATSEKVGCIMAMTAAVEDTVEKAVECTTLVVVAVVDMVRDTILVAWVWDSADLSHVMK
jgi:hypothetical protein